MENQEYQDPILKKYADLITANTKAFKQVYFGDPIRVGASSLPALVLAKVDTRVMNMTNQEDQHQVRISMTVITDVRDTISDEKTMVSGVNSLYNLMEGRAANYALLPTSLLYIIRHNVELDVANNLRTDLNTVSQVDYGMTMGKRKENAWALEGSLAFVAHFTQVR